jgi:T4 RnlA family RNA ligase
MGIPSLNECRAISAGKNAFVKKTEHYKGHTIHIFGATYSYPGMYETPQHLEMRGITFVDGECYPSIPKFFNHGEIDHPPLTIENVATIQEKQDGSLITFLKIGDEIKAKSKMSLFSEQALLADELLVRDHGIESYVRLLLLNGIVPFFELTGPDNPIVVKYPYNMLKLIQLRDMKTGEFLPLPEVEATEERVLALDTQEEGVEGWVVRFKNGNFCKVKTDWYVKLHRVKSQFVEQPHTVIKLGLENKLDDLIGVLSRECDKELVRSVERFNSKLIRHVVYTANQLLDSATLLSGERRTYVEQCKKFVTKDITFGMLMSAFKYRSQAECENIVAQNILKATNKKEKALKWLYEHDINIRGVLE